MPCVTVLATKLLVVCCLLFVVRMTRRRFDTGQRTTDMVYGEHPTFLLDHITLTLNPSPIEGEGLKTILLPFSLNGRRGWGMRVKKTGMLP